MSEQMYVNAYAVSRNYGGPEEGGWWYDSGKLLTSIPVIDQDSAERIKTLLAEGIGWEDGNGGLGRQSVLGGSDFRVWIEDEPGEDFPEHRPYYE